MAGRRQVIHANDVVNAKEDLSARLERPAPLVDEDGDAYWGPSVVCAATTWEDFERWLNVNEGRLKRWDFEPLNDGTDRGIVVIYSLPSKVHEDAAHSIANSVEDELRAGPEIVAKNQMQVLLTPVDLDVGGGVLAAAHNAPFPNVIIEVAYKNGSLPLLRAKLQRWMDHDTSVQVAIGIKIFVGPVTSRRVAILHRRG
ncbi:hypothetical protein V7S43_009916 [Phytophthora oleae]|uniref:Restriction endonuclease domain-containing protein n=1 Tax=Phytophthora oleae TaxID=2107226 RepID=A0ABD3FET8_9STRA